MRRLSTWVPTLVRSATTRRCIADARPFAAGDLVLLRQKQDRTATILTRPLEPGKRIESHKGFIRHEDIIGKRVRDVVKSTTTKSERGGIEFRLHEVTLDEYVRMSKRLVTPIYPADANLIVSLLDLHTDVAGLSSEKGEHVPKLDILEAGTGHGALTLHLSRALHAANVVINEDNADYESEAWKLKRRAVLHTTDISPKYSMHAQKVVRGFRRGVYARNVDFHIGDVSDIVSGLHQSRGFAPFLSHAFLDLPSADRHLAAVADVLRTDGTLIVFNPSITQVIDCANKIKNEKIPLDLDRVVELGLNASSGGRDWDVRFVRPRASQTITAEEVQTVPEEEPSANESEAGTESDLRLATSNKGDWSMVCRPKVGDRIVGGGFLGVWKKKRQISQASQLEEQ